MKSFHRNIVKYKTYAYHIILIQAYDYLGDDYMRVIEEFMKAQEKVAKIKMKLIINKDLYADNCITYETYRSIEEKLQCQLKQLDVLAAE